MTQAQKPHRPSASLRHEITILRIRRLGRDQHPRSEPYHDIFVKANANHEMSRKSHFVRWWLSGKTISRWGKLFSNSELQCFSHQLVSSEVPPHTDWREDAERVCAQWTLDRDHNINYAKQGKVKRKIWSDDIVSSFFVCLSVWLNYIYCVTV